MVRSLAEALVLGLDADLMKRLAALSPTHQGTIILRKQKPLLWFEISATGKTVVHRQRPTEHETADLDQILADSALINAYRSSIESTRAVQMATRIIDPIYGSLERVTRADYERIRPWAPLLEQVAYRGATQATMTADALRRAILDKLRLGIPADVASLDAYWCAIHLGAHLLLISSDPNSTWLGDLAAHFDWARWTPTFWLVRERTTWLAAAAARSSMAFGESAVPIYLKALRNSRHPMIAFDALFGLASIGLSEPVIGSHLAKELRDAKAKHMPFVEAHHDYFEIAYENAIHLILHRTLGSGSFRAYAELGWYSKGAEGMATRPGFLSDPAALIEPRLFRGFAMLPFVVSSEAPAHYPQRSRFARRGPRSLHSQIETIFRRAWVPDLKHLH